MPQLSDVEAVTLTMTTPFAAVPAAALPNFRVSVTLPGSNTSVQHAIRRRRVSTGYFSTLGIRVLQGRELDARDRREADAADVASGIPVVLNRTAAARLFPGVDPLGQRIRAVDEAESFRDEPGSSRETPFYVVGVTEDVGSALMSTEATPTMYWPMTTASFARSTRLGMVLALRATPGRVVRRAV